MNITNIADLCININIKLLEGMKLYQLDNIIKLYIGLDWIKYVHFLEETYNKVKIYEDDLIEIILICWNENQESYIHDHPSNGCLLKILDGKLLEENYINLKLDNTIKKINEIEMNINNIFYKEGSDILHRIKNYKNKSISLHIYSPPKYKSNIY
jgi:cysteine dioxygenase